MEISCISGLNVIRGQTIIKDKRHLICTYPLNSTWYKESSATVFTALREGRGLRTWR